MINGEYMFEVKIDGIKEIQDMLKNREKKIKEIGESGEIPLDEIITTEFMKKHTKYDNFADFIISSKLVPPDTEIITNEIFETIPDKEFDDYIADNTPFKSWNEMLETAFDEYITKQWKS